MTNNERFKDWMKEINKEDGSVIDELIEQKVRKLKRNKHIRWATIPLTSFISMVLVFTLLINLNDAFYAYAISNPILKPLTQLVNNRQDILSAFDSGYVQLIDKTITVGDYTLEVDSIISDTRSINMFYKVRYQGKLIDEFEPSSNPSFDFTSLCGDSIGYATSYHHFENYQWAEISLKSLNDYEPLLIKFTPNNDLVDLYGELQVNIDQSKVIQPVYIQINETIMVGGQKLIIKNLEMGAFSSQLTYYLDAKNEKMLVLIVFKDSTSGVSWDDESVAVNYKYENFPIGQLNHEKNISLELKNASVLDRAFETINFDPVSRTFSALPEHLTLKDVVVIDNKYEIIFEEYQSVGNQGLMPIMNGSVEDVSWFSEGPASSNLSVHHVSFFLKNDQLVKFKVLGGTELGDLPKPVIIQLP
jgi:hypothetical protein